VCKKENFQILNIPDKSEWLTLKTGSAILHVWFFKSSAGGAFLCEPVNLTAH